MRMRRISKRTQYEIGALVGVIGICVIIAAAVRFDAFLASDQRFRSEFAPYLMAQNAKKPETAAENKQMYQHRERINKFHPSGNKYSRCPELVVGSSSGLTILAAGVWICLRARRRREPLH